MQARVKEIIHDWIKYSNRKVWPCWSPGHSISQCLSVKLAVGSHTTAAAPCKQAQLRDKGYLLHVSSLPRLLPEPGLVPQHKAALHSEHGPAGSKLAQASLTRPSIMLFRPDNFVSSSIQTPWNVRNWSQMHIDVLKSSWILFRNTQVTGLSPGDGSNIMAYDTKRMWQEMITWPQPVSTDLWFIKNIQSPHSQTVFTTITLSHWKNSRVIIQSWNSTKFGNIVFSLRLNLNKI